MLQMELTKSNCAVSRASYSRYLSFFSRRLNDKSLVVDLALDGCEDIEATLANDPSRFDLWLKLAKIRLGQGRKEEASLILRRVASSRYPEASVACRELGRIFNEMVGVRIY